jgi:hypothetical protein
MEFTAPGWAEGAQGLGGRHQPAMTLSLETAVVGSGLSKVGAVAELGG